MTDNTAFNEALHPRDAKSRFTEKHNTAPGVKLPSGERPLSEPTVSLASAGALIPRIDADLEAISGRRVADDEKIFNLGVEAVTVIIKDDERFADATLLQVYNDVEDDGEYRLAPWRIYGKDNEVLWENPEDSWEENPDELAEVLLDYTSLLDRKPETALHIDGAPSSDKKQFLGIRL